MANAAIDSTYTPPTTYTIGTATTRLAVAPAVPAVNASAVHIVVPGRVKRWNGTTWVPIYTPRF